MNSNYKKQQIIRGYSYYSHVSTSIIRTTHTLCHTEFDGFRLFVVPK